VAAAGGYAGDAGLLVAPQAGGEAAFARLIGPWRRGFVVHCHRMLGSPQDAEDAAWARAAGNPVGGWYGLKKGLRGRFAMYVPPLLEHRGLVELEHNARNNRTRAR
jgi:hypothetical protein